MRNLDLLIVRVAAILIALPSAACVAGPGPGDDGEIIDTSLTEARGKADLSIELGFPDSEQDGYVVGGPPPVSLFFGVWSHLYGGNDCPVLGSETTATVNGQTLTTVSLGYAGGGICQVPQWNVDPTVRWPASSVAVVITDSSGSLEADFINVDVPRTAALVTPGDGAAHVGDTLTLQLSPATDIFPTSEDDQEHFGWLTCEFGNAAPPPDGVNTAQASAPVIYANGIATCVVPDGAVGTSKLFLAEDGVVGTSRCDVGHCDMEFTLYTPVVPLTVTR